MTSKMNQTSTLELKTCRQLHFWNFLIILNTFRWFLLLSCLFIYLVICLFVLFLKKVGNEEQDRANGKKAPGFWTWGTLTASRLFYGYSWPKGVTSRHKLGLFQAPFHSWPQTFAFWTKQWAIVSPVMPDFEPKRTRHESVNYGISNYLST